MATSIFIWSFFLRPGARCKVGLVVKLKCKERRTQRLESALAPDGGRSLDQPHYRFSEADRDESGPGLKNHLGVAPSLETLEVGSRRDSGFMVLHVVVTETFEMVQQPAASGLECLDVLTQALAFVLKTANEKRFVVNPKPPVGGIGRPVHFREWTIDIAERGEPGNTQQKFPIFPGTRALIEE